MHTFFPSLSHAQIGCIGWRSPNSLYNFNKCGLDQDLGTYCFPLALQFGLPISFYHKLCAAGMLLWDIETHFFMAKAWSAEVEKHK
ncbi:hypothetical protein F2P79_001903 [Pimephales promelas]|nr:hypothetical protein F2P79_001903 [Pimephales promelas]